jgi:opacity protein-like surface antigen
MLGFDRQVRERYVVGLFTEFDWSSIELSYEDTVLGLQTFTMDRTFSVGGRAGFLLTQTSLLYLTAGYSWSHGKSDGYFDIDDGVFYPGVTSLNLSGPFVGIGMETQLNQSFSLRGEVRYTMYGDEVVNSDPGVPFTDKFNADLLTGRLAVTYKFNR